MDSLFDQVDVLVIGGGTAGTIAAIQASRARVHIAIVEMQRQLRGTMTTGGVSAPAYFWGRYRQPGHGSCAHGN